jgi:hypothetical protein
MAESTQPGAKSFSFLKPAPLFGIFLGLEFIALFTIPVSVPYIAYVFGILAMAAVIAVSYKLPPSTPLRETSALFARLDWLGKFLFAAVVLFAGVFFGVAGQIAVDGVASASAGLELLIFFFERFLLTCVLPVGATVACFALAADLHRAGARGRADAFESWVGVTGPSWLVSLIRTLGSGLSAPWLAVPATLLAIPAAFYIQA